MRKKTSATLGLAGLRPGTKMPVEGVVGQEPAFWEGSGLAFEGGVAFSAVAEMAADGALVVRGSWSGRAAYECARCLEPLQLAVRKELVLFFALNDEWARDDPDVRTIDAGATEADLGEAIREEALLEMPQHYMPAAGRDGRCVECGASTSRTASAGPDPQGRPDPRWAALETLKTD